MNPGGTGEGGGSYSRVNSIRSPSSAPGSRRGFYKIRQHYQILLGKRYSGSAHDLLRGEFPSLALGISGASLHCLEDLGYAACAGMPPGPVVDAVAYLHHSFCPNFISIPRQGHFGV